VQSTDLRASRYSDFIVCLSPFQSCFFDRFENSRQEEFPKGLAFPDSPLSVEAAFMIVIVPSSHTMPVGDTNGIFSSFRHVQRSDCHQFLSRHGFY
jgi:hypothetical protein